MAIGSVTNSPIAMAQTPAEGGRPRSRNGAPMFALAILVFVLAIAFTRASFLGDTFDCGASVSDFAHGHIYEFWDPGHVLWKPLGFVLLEVLKPITKLWAGSDDFSNAIVQLIGINLVAGLSCVILLYAWLRRLGMPVVATLVATSAFVISNAFLNWTHTGVSYIPGLACVLLAFYLQAGREDGSNLSVPRAAFAGLAFGLGVCFWLPYILAGPAILLFAIVAHGWEEHRAKAMAISTLAAALVGVLVYGPVILHLHLSSIAAVREWLKESSHGITHIKGVARMAFGFARSWIDLGDDGPLFKRYLLHDHYNPVSLWNLVQLSLWKLALFYCFLAALALALWRSRASRPWFWLLVLNALPVLSFAIMWQGGDTERYLALYPAIFLAIAAVLGNFEVGRWARVVVLLFLVALAATNLPALSAGHLRSAERQLWVEWDALSAQKTGGIALVETHSKLANFPRQHPLAIRKPGLRVYEVVELGREDTPNWRPASASVMLSTWSKGGDVWASKCFLNPRPEARCNWIEGEDDRVSWNSLYSFFSQLEKGRSLAEGFVLLAPSDKNKVFLSSFLARAKP